MIVDAVKYAGGHATKLSHRFLVGVPDLLIKLQSVNVPAGLVEVKQHKWPAEDRVFDLEVTPPQRRVLGQFNAAGMPCGVASFLQKGAGNSRELYLSVMSYQTLQYSDGTIKPFTCARSAHVVLSKNPERRYLDIVSELEKWVVRG